MQTTYVGDTENDAHLHLVTIDEHKAIRRSMPGGIDPKGICMSVGNGDNHRVFLSVWPRPPSVEQMHPFGKDIVVHESGEDAEQAHEKNDVATVDECANDLKRDKFNI